MAYLPTLDGSRRSSLAGKMHRSFAPLRMTILKGMRKFASLLRDTRGAAILEFAISIPLLVVFVVGIYDFSSAFNQKQKIAQAAQEGAILAASQPMSDIATTSGNPPSLQGVSTAIYNSLLGSGVLPAGTCSPPGTVTGPSGLTWIYTISGCNPAHPAPGADDLVITINRGWVSTATTPTTIGTVGTVVTVKYTYYWFGFNQVIQLLFPSGTGYAPTTLLTEASSVHNQT
jgi:hypothetical protein